MLLCGVGLFSFFFFLFPSLLFPAFSQHTGAEDGVSTDVRSCGWHPRPGTSVSTQACSGHLPPLPAAPGREEEASSLL